MDLEIANRKALICAASRGLGLACAEALAVEGAAVHLVARHADPLAEVASRLSETYGVEVTFTAADLHDTEGRKTILDEAGSIDILITNPGVSPGAPVLDADAEVWAEASGRIVHSAMDLVRAVLPGMKERRWGRIVHITSSAALHVNPVLGLSGAVRAALTNVSAALARETAPYNVTMNTVAPGAVETDELIAVLARIAAARGLDAAAFAEERRQAVPVGRFGKPREIGELCAFLCGENAGYLTGKTFLPDGGMSSWPYA